MAASCCGDTAGPEKLVRVEGKINATKYRGIPEENLMQSVEELWHRRRFVFQQDDEPKHTAKATNNWFKNNKVIVLECPSQHSDLNSTGDFVTGLKKGCLFMIPMQPDRAWAVLQRRMRKIYWIDWIGLSAVIAARSASTKYWMKVVNTCSVIYFLLYF